MINLANFSSIFIANWKLNGNIEFIKEYYQKLIPNSKNCIVICSPNIYLNQLKSNNKFLLLFAKRLRKIFGEQITTQFLELGNNF